MKAAAALITAWLLVYAPTVTGGFIKDDFAWLQHSRIDSWSSIYALFATADDFYRPVVRLSFGLTEAVFGPTPLPYGLTNLLLALACAAAIALLARALALPSWAALVAAAIWAFNFHGINMAVVWLSGRTSLLGTLFATLAAWCVLRDRRWSAALFAFAALLSKEEVIALPLIVSLWQLMDRRSLLSVAPVWIVFAIYLALRANSGAFGVTTAPSFYRFTTDPMLLVRNVIEYADRSMTLAAAVTLAGIAALGRFPQLTSEDKYRMLKATIWLIGGFAVTLWLPVRSSLYAVLPSVGGAIVAATLLAASAKQVDARRAWQVAGVGLVLPFLLVPIYWSRNGRWTALRALSSETLLVIKTQALPPQTLVVLEDDLSTRTNFRNTFGALFPEAAAVYFGDDLHLWIEPPPPEVENTAVKRPDASHVVTLRLSAGRVEPVTSSAESAMGANRQTPGVLPSRRMPPQ